MTVRTYGNTRTHYGSAPRLLAAADNVRPSGLVPAAVRASDLRWVRLFWARRYPVSVGRDLRRRVLVALVLLTWLDEQAITLKQLRQDN